MAAARRAGRSESRGRRPIDRGEGATEAGGMRASWLLGCLAIAAGLCGCGASSGPPSRIAEPAEAGSGPAVAWGAAGTLLSDGFPYGLAVDGRGRAYVALEDDDGFALRRAD